MPNTTPEKFFISADTEVLTPEGFKNFANLERDTDIYACHEGRLVLNRCLGVEYGDYEGEMYRLAGKTIEMVVSVKSTLPCLLGSKYKEIPASEIMIGSGGFCSIPYFAKNSEADFTITEATLKKWGKARKLPADPFLFSSNQLLTILRSWPDATKSKLAVLDATEADKLQHILMLAGQGSKRDGGFVRVIDEISDNICRRERLKYSGVVWRPIIRCNAAIFRRLGVVFAGPCS